ncbi:MAG: YolD-like family protein [Clostridiales bacterium]|nr:YolD-like family protein [Clostridiales bacterium]
MDRLERAKQFAPFAALKGYPDALRKKEKVVVEKISLSDESSRILNLKMQQIQKRDMITVVYFFKNEYLKLTGMVSRIDSTSRILKIVNTNIPFDDIYDISGEKIRIDDV